MKALKKVSIALLVVGISVAFAQDSNADNHKVSIVIPQIALLDIEPEASKDISLSLDAPTEAGDPLAEKSDNNLWLNVTSSVSGEWNYTIPVSDISEAGEDFSGTYTSDPNQAYIDISYNRNWKVSVQKNNIDWNNKIKIYARRTGSGWGSARRISGGTNFLRIKNKNSNFFSGRGWYFSLPIQYEIRKVSVTIPAHTYIVEILYTLQAN